MKLAAPYTVESCAAPDPLAVIREEHALQLELCNLLETIADGLPAMFDRALAAIAVSILEGSVAAHTKFEDEALFPILKARLQNTDTVVSAIACLAEEHNRDADIVNELTDALKSAIGSGVVQNPEMLGYVLRGYFESQRRHIAWEDSVVLPAASCALTKGDLVALQDWIMRSNHPRCSRQSLLAIKDRSGPAVCRECQSVTRKEDP